MLALPSSSVKLSDLDLLLASLEPVTVEMFSGCICGRKFEVDSFTAAWLPIGVANDSFGAVGREAGRRYGRSGKGVDPSPFTGFAFGEGGIPRVKRGVLEPL